MTSFCIPWLDVCVLTPLLGALAARRIRRAETAQGLGIAVGAAALATGMGAWMDPLAAVGLATPNSAPLLSALFGPGAFALDALSGPLVPLAALLYLMTALATLRTKLQRFSFSWSLLSLSLTLAILACQNRHLLATLMIASAAPPLVELRGRGRPWRTFAWHMGAFAGLLAIGWLGFVMQGSPATPSGWVVAALIAAVLLRSGVVPVHCWMTQLFEHATFGTALLFVTPMTGAYAAVRLVLPLAPQAALNVLSLASLLTAVYAAALALVQVDARRFFCCLFLSHSSLVLVGLQTGTTIGLTGGLAVWLSVGLALTGFGLTLRSLEARCGRLTLDRYHGMYERTPALASCFLLTGLASVGFPGTIGFVATEVLIDGAVQAHPHVGLAVVLAAALNGIAIVQAYFRLFTGVRVRSTIALTSRVPERLAVLTLTVLIVGGGLFPQPGILSRYRAAAEILAKREAVDSGAKGKLLAADVQGDTSILP